ncbi:hypothetical protein B0T16DRAFT_422251 [Cercophora newfieldiana]|uniref:Uncharacterized protein n=1 Tax=Cercophora newfieldiana TaxID=92897 RepID=A0AA39XRQ4_9PEZI|nr:hypothetical protein B0T16DRAFT_422251 [Cercophora newfieldiana]
MTRRLSRCACLGPLHGELPRMANRPRTGLDVGEGQENRTHHVYMNRAFPHKRPVLGHLTQSATKQTPQQSSHQLPSHKTMLQQATNNNQKPNDWAAQVNKSAQSDARVRPWESVVEKAESDKSQGDAIDLNANPQGACDISVSA